MKAKDDQERQQLLREYEAAHPISLADASVYRALDEALAQPPSILLSRDFATRVTARAFHQPVREAHRLKTALTVVVALSLLLSVLAINYTNATSLTAIVHQVWQIKEVTVFVIVMLALVQLGDYWFVKRPSNFRRPMV